MVFAIRARNLLLALVVIVGGGWWGYLEWDSRSAQGAVEALHKYMMDDKIKCEELKSEIYCGAIKSREQDFDDVVRWRDDSIEQQKTLSYWLGLLLFVTLIFVPALRYLLTGQLRKPKTIK